MIPFNYNVSHIIKCEELLSDLFNTHVLLTPSCTAALEMTALLLDIQPGDEFILPSFTFSSTANAFMLRGATPVFCDIRPDTLNIDENLIEDLITDRTKAIVPVHYAGIGCEMSKVMDIANGYNISIIEDNAHGLFGKYEDSWLGTIGSFGCHSFHYTKNFSCGEGGALFINNPEYLKKVHVIRDKGTNRQQFIDGEINKYSWVGLGGSYSISDLLAEELLKQLGPFISDRWLGLEAIQFKRGELFWLYKAKLFDWTVANKVGITSVSHTIQSAYHIFWLILPTIQDRVNLQSHLSSKGIQSSTHYQPLHLSPMNTRKAYCPVTEDIAPRLLRLPLYHQLSFEDQEKIIEAVLEYECK